MDKGWGLTLESSDKVSVFGNKPAVPPGFSLSPRLNNNNKGVLMFPLNSSGRDHHAAAPTGVVLGELDFFSGNKRPASDELNRPVKKETNSGGELLETGLQLVIAANKTGSDGSTVDDGVSSDNLDDRRAKIEQLGQLRIELERMNAENQRLKGMLTQVGNNYAALQMQLVTLMQNSQDSESEKPQEGVGIEKNQENEAELVPRQFLDLAPGVARQTSDEQSNSESEERTQSGSPRDNIGLSGNKRVIGPDESPESENWAPNKSPKLNPPKPAGGVDQSSEATMRKARVSVRARSEAPMISDGCQWRKYGQKMAKGNPCPRAYYRCTMAAGCPVRKQVQRCAEDQTILITTYEGNHSHPLPPAAMAMASTTSAAANMLLSGSMPSPDTLMHPNFLARTMLPCSSNMATISASAPFPTITLDLTQPPNPSPFQRPSPTFHLPQSGFPAHVQIPPQFFGQPIYNQSRFSGLQMSNDHPQAGDHLTTQMPGNSPPPSSSAFAETLSAATAAITKDPNFTAALAAAISSIIGGGQTTTNNAGGQLSSNNNPGVNTDKNN